MRCCIVVIFLMFLPGVVKIANGTNNPALKKSGKSVTDFIPENWEVYAQARGDLNKDKITDIVLVLQKNDTTLYTKNKKGEVTANNNPRILVVLFANAQNTGYTVAESTNSLILNHTSGHSADPFQCVAIKNGILEISMQRISNDKSRHCREACYKFRYQNSRFEMIGAEVTNYHKGTGEFTDHSFNFSIRTMITSKGNYKKNEKPAETTKKFALTNLYNFKSFSKPFSTKIEGAEL